MGVLCQFSGVYLPNYKSEKASVSDRNKMCIMMIGGLARPYHIGHFLNPCSVPPRKITIKSIAALEL